MEAEQIVNTRIKEFQKKFGIVEEDAIVDEDDYEKTIVFEDEDINAVSMGKKV